MARTVEMRLVELMSLKQDVANVIEHLGKKGVFQFQQTKNSSSNSNTANQKYENIDKKFFDELDSSRVFLKLDDLNEDEILENRACDADRDEAGKLLANVSSLKERYEQITENNKKISDAYREASAFSNLQVSFDQLEHLSFLSMRIGKLPATNIGQLKEALGSSVIIVPLGENSSSILAATSKKGRFAMDTELKKAGFVELNIPKDFKGVPENALEGLRLSLEQNNKQIDDINEEIKNFASSRENNIF